MYGQSQGELRELKSRFEKSEKEHEDVRNESQATIESLTKKYEKSEFQHTMALREIISLKQQLEDQTKEAGETSLNNEDTIKTPSTAWKVLGYVPFVAPLAVAAFSIFRR